MPDLLFGALTRGLGKVTEKREKGWTDHTGRRRTTTEYFIATITFLIPAVAEAEHKRECA